jgi:alpha-tubulin suppressor-like RCC1 family protein
MEPDNHRSNSQSSSSSEQSNKSWSSESSSSPLHKRPRLEESHSSTQSNANDNQNNDSTMSQEHNNSDAEKAAAANNHSSEESSATPAIVTGDDLETLQHDLARVEEGLTRQRGILFDTSLESNAHNSQQSGRAVFDSLGSALGNIRSRWQDMMMRMSSSDTTASRSNDGSSEAAAAAAAAIGGNQIRRQSEMLTALSQRLTIAERAHSTRMPLNLLQQQQEREAEESASVDSVAPSASAPSPPMSQTMSRSVSSGGDSFASSAGGGGGSSDDGSGDSATRAKRRRSSTLLASRRHAEVHERQDLELHEGTASSHSGAMPKTIPEEQSEEMKKEDTDDVQEEVELLLPESTREQLDKLSSRSSQHILTGSLRVLSQGKSKSSSLEEEKGEEIIDKDDTTMPPIPPRDVQSYPPLYVWGSLTFQSSTCNSPSQPYQIFGNVATDDDNNEQDKSLTLVEDPKLLPPETRLGRSDIASMSVSDTHMAFSTSSGRVLICGDNRAGAVDPSQKSAPSIPRPMHLELLAMNRVLIVSCGADHTAALTETKSVLTWGSNLYGQLGHRKHDIISFARPAAFALSGRAADVACGDGFTMVLTTRMEVYICGREEITGYNAQAEQNEDGKGPLIRLPEQNSALQGLPLVQIAAGGRHAVVVTAHGTAYALGSNDFGQCGRMFPKNLHVPVPISVPKTTQKACAEKPLITSTALPNWDIWEPGEPLSLAKDVNIIHAACGRDHTILVTQSGSLLVCGANEVGQLGFSNSGESTSFASLQTVDHPDSSRKFLSAEAGLEHTLLLDDSGSVWETGNGKFSLRKIAFQVSNCRTAGLAAGGFVSLAIGEKKSDALKTQRQDHATMSLDELVEAIRIDQDRQGSGTRLIDHLPPDDELARRTEELFRSPAVMNSQFMDPNEIDEFYAKLIECAHAREVQQKVVSAMEKGMKQALESLREARLMYPEAVRLLLLLVQCPLFRQEMEQDEEKTLQFDVRGDLLVLLCESILGLPFEGYKALMAWTSTLYGQDLFVSFLVRPLVFQLNKRLEKQRTYGVPMIAGVLRWLHNVAEQSERELATSEDFHCVGIEELPMEVLFNDLARFRLSTKADRSVNFYLAANSFLMSPTVKRNLLQVEHQLQMVQAAQSGGVSFDPTTREFMFKPYFVLAIDRKYLLQQTLQVVASATPRELKKSLKVVFKGEDGVDAGGVTKEFFQLLIQKLFDINTGMWKVENEHEYWFNSDCTWNDDGFYLVGVLVGLAFYNSVILDVHFPHAVYRKLLGVPLGLEDIVDNDVRNGLKNLLEYEGDDVEDMFCLNFEVSWTVLGQERKKELKPDGANIPVTGSNKEEFVMLYVKWLLMDSVQTQYAEFERGFMQVMEGSSLDLLRPKELELLVVGTPELDFAALEKAARYEGGFDGNDNVVKNLWRWVQSASRDTQLKFLKFCTGSNKGEITEAPRSVMLEIGSYIILTNVSLAAPIGGLGKLPFLVQRYDGASQSFLDRFLINYTRLYARLIIIATTVFVFCFQQSGARFYATSYCSYVFQHVDTARLWKRLRKTRPTNGSSRLGMRRIWIAVERLLAIPSSSVMLKCCLSTTTKRQQAERRYYNNT